MPPCNKTNNKNHFDLEFKLLIMLSLVCVIAGHALMISKVFFICSSRNQVDSHLCCRVFQQIMERTSDSPGTLQYLVPRDSDAQ